MTDYERQMYGSKEAMLDRIREVCFEHGHSPTGPYHDIVKWIADELSERIDIECIPIAVECDCGKNVPVEIAPS